MLLDISISIVLLIVFWNIRCGHRGIGLRPSFHYVYVYVISRSQVIHSEDKYTGAHERSYSTSGPVSTGMGDPFRTGRSPRYVTSHPGQLSLLPSTGRDSSNLPEPGRRPVRNQILLHYPNRRQVRGWSQTCCRPITSCWLAASELNAKFQLAAGLRPASDLSATR